MFSPVSDIVENDAALQALLGDPVRVFSFGEAPQHVVKPYVVHQTVGGSPENYLGTAPDTDGLIVQVDVYAENPASAKAVTRVLVPLLEAQGHVTTWNGEFRELDTRSFRISFTAEFKTPR